MMIVPGNTGSAYRSTSLTDCFTGDDEASAVQGGRVLLEVSDELTDLHFRLGLIEQVLHTAAVRSARAEQVRAAVAKALHGLENSVLGAVDDAHCALVFRWGNPPHTAGHPVT